MKILVTGSSGMIGSELVPLLEKDNEVYCIDKVEPVFTTPQNFMQIDLRYKFNIINRKYDLVIHLAANARVHDLVIDPSLALDNCIISHNVLEFARNYKIPRIIFASSREVYGNGNSLPVAEHIGSQRNCESPYSASKIFGEAECHAYRTCYGIDTRIVRFSNVYGRYDFSNRFVPKIISQLKKDLQIEIWGKDKILDFTYITDVTECLNYMIGHWDKLKHNEYNISAGYAATLLDVANTLKELIGSKSEIVVTEAKVGEVTAYEGDVSRIKKIGWAPLVELNAGLINSINYYGKTNY